VSTQYPSILTCIDQVVVWLTAIWRINFQNTLGWLGWFELGKKLQKLQVTSSYIKLHQVTSLTGGLNFASSFRFGEDSCDATAASQLCQRCQASSLRAGRSHWTMCGLCNSTWEPWWSLGYPVDADALIVTDIGRRDWWPTVASKAWDFDWWTFQSKKKQATLNHPRSP
jgi:hypothetical protein